MIVAPWIAPFNPFDPLQISLWDGKLPPSWIEGGQSQYILGTDNQGRDMLSTILYGGRLSIIVGLAAVCLGMVLGVMLGVISGYFGGAVDSIIMRIADIQLTIPGILLAILINGRATGRLCHLRCNIRYWINRLATVCTCDPQRNHGGVQQGICTSCPSYRLTQMVNHCEAHIAECYETCPCHRYHRLSVSDYF